MKNKKAKYVKPESSVFHVFAECQGGVKVSYIDGGPENGGDGDGSGSGDSGNSGMNSKQNTGWFDWDEEPEE